MPTEANYQAQINEPELTGQEPVYQQPASNQQTVFKSGGERVIQPLNTSIQPNGDSQTDDIASQIARELGEPPLTQ